MACWPPSAFAPRAYGTPVACEFDTFIAERVGLAVGATGTTARPEAEEFPIHGYVLR